MPKLIATNVSREIADRIIKGEVRAQNSSSRDGTTHTPADGVLFEMARTDLDTITIDVVEPSGLPPHIPSSLTFIRRNTDTGISSVHEIRVISGESESAVKRRTSVRRTAGEVSDALSSYERIHRPMEEEMFIDTDEYGHIKASTGVSLLQLLSGAKLYPHEVTLYLHFV